MSTTINEVKAVKNTDIRNLAKESNVKLWMIAERLGMNDGNFSRKLRRELGPTEKEKIIRIIQSVKQEDNYGN